MKKTKGIILSLALCMLFTSTTSFAANKDFKFSLSSTASQESSLGSAVKSNDGDKNAYITPSASGSNLAIRGARVNFRVRDNASNYATNLVTVANYQRYVVSYLSGKNVGGASYRLYSNVSSTNAYPVNLAGVWCP